MAGVRDIRRRIRSVRNMMQITKAMKMVSAARLRKAQERMTAARPYARQLQEVLARLAQTQAQTEVEHPLLTKRPVHKVGYVVLTSDRGLAGGFNANIIRKTTGLVSEQEHEVELITVGRKGRDFFRRAKMTILTEYVGLGDNISYQQAKAIAQDIAKYYINGELDEVYLVFPEFMTVMTQIPTQLKVLPIDAPSEKAEEGDYIIEPSPAAIIDRLLPKYLETQIFRALLEAKAGEQGARMTAMGAATDNASELIGRLTLAMNRARQAAITKEISEIVGGAAALE